LAVQFFDPRLWIRPDQVEAAAGTPRPAARGTDPGDDEAVGRGPETVLGADRIPEPADFVVAEFDDLIALGTVHVVMRRITEIVLVGGAVGQAKFAEEPGLDEESEGPIDRRPAHLATGLAEVGDQLVGVEVLVGIEDMANQDAPGFGQLLAPDLQELAELVFRSGLLDDWPEGGGLRHDG
jgi:hypothetical protein